MTGCGRAAAVGDDRRFAFDTPPDKVHAAIEETNR